MDLSNPSQAILPSVRGAVLRALAQTDEPLSGRAVASISGPDVGYRRVSQVLGELVEAGVVLRESHPPAYLYRLNRDHVAAEPIVMLADLRARLLRRMSEASASWEIQPEAMWLFGSAALGDGTTSSDIDLLILRPKSIAEDDPSWRRQLDHFASDVTAWSGNDCQILEYSPRDLAYLISAGDPLVRELQRDAITIAGRPPREALRPGKRLR